MDDAKLGKPSCHIGIDFEINSISACATGVDGV